MSFTLRSASFSEGGQIPQPCTCDGANLSPSLSWKDAPRGTKSFALIVEDSDAPGGTWTHWIAWNIPAAMSALPAGLPALTSLGGGICQGRNDFGRIGYGGPCPPRGRVHHYYFRLFALDKVLNLRAGSSRMDLESAGRGHVLAQASTICTYKR